MELIFIRHAQGEHTLNLPESLHLTNPSLSIQGRIQAQKLRSTLPLTSEDVLIVSPTLRTLQTASIWSDTVDCDKLVHPLVSPRIFPPRLAAKTLSCDELLDLERLQIEFPTFVPEPNLASSLWSTGINLLAEIDLTCWLKSSLIFAGACNAIEFILSHMMEP